MRIDPDDKLLDGVRIGDSCPGIPLPRNKDILEEMNKGKKEKFWLTAIHKGKENGGISNILRSRIPWNTSMGPQEVVDELWRTYKETPGCGNMWPAAREWLKKIKTANKMPANIKIPE